MYAYIYILIYILIYTSLYIRHALESEGGKKRWQGGRAKARVCGRYALEDTG